MVVTTANLSSGPKLDKGIDKGVHIIRLVADTGGAAGGPPPGGGPHAAKNIVASPTDILVFDHQPWHFVNDQVVSHDTAHHDYPETILRVRAEKERAVWWSEERFQISAIDESHLDPHPNGKKPFPPPATVDATDAQGRTIYVARSAPPQGDSKNHFYKISFAMGTDDIDPDMEITP